MSERQSLGQSSSDHQNQVEVELSELRATCPCFFCVLPLEIQGEICRWIPRFVFWHLQHLSPCWRARFRLFESRKVNIACFGEPRSTSAVLFDPAAFRPTALPPMHAERTFPAGIYSEGYVYALGGFGPRAKTTCERYDWATNQWHDIAPMPTERIGAAAAVSPKTGHLLVMNGAATQAVDEYVPSRDTWILGAPLLIGGYPWFAPAAVTHWDHNAVYLMGGREHWGQFVRHVYLLDARAQRWQERSIMLHKRSRFGAVVFGDSIYAMGGTAESTRSTIDDHFSDYHATVERYDVRADRWEAVAAMQCRRSAHGVVGLAGPDGHQAIVAFGGTNGGETLLTSVEVYDVATDIWRAGPELSSPMAFFATAVV